MKTLLSSPHSFNFLHPSNLNPSSSPSSAFSPSSSLSFNKPQNNTLTTKSAPTTTTTTVTQTRNPNPKPKIKKVFFLDVNPLCYQGSNPSLHSFAQWFSRFLSPQLTQTHPIIAVVDGNGGSEYRRKLLPSYKANRVKFTSKISTPGGYGDGFVGRFHPVISNVLGKCNVPVSFIIPLFEFYFNILKLIACSKDLRFGECDFIFRGRRCFNYI